MSSSNKNSGINNIDSNLLNRNIVANNADLIIVFDEKGNTIECNNTAQKAFGYSREEALIEKENIFFKRKTSFDEIKRVIKKEKEYKGLIEFKHKEKKDFINLISAFRINGNNKRTACYVICGKDADRLEEFTKKIRNTEKIYKELFDNSTDLIQVVDLKGNIIGVNKVWLKTLGYTKKQSQNLNINNVISNQNNHYKKGDFIEDILNSKEGKLKVVVFIDKSGNELILKGTSTIDYNKGKPATIRSIFRNITDVRKAQNKLKINSTRLNAVFNNSTHIFWIVDERICLTAFNKNFAQAIKDRYGIYPELNMDYGTPKNYFSNSEKHEFWNEKYKEAFKGNVVKFETKNVYKNGKIGYRETFLNPIILPDGKIREVSGIAHDITEKKYAEEKLKEQTAKINSIFESASNMLIFSFDTNFKIRSFNKNFAKNLLLRHGIAIETDMVINYRDLSALSENKNAIEKAIERAFLGNHSQIIFSVIDINNQKEWYEVIFNPVYFESGKVSEISCLAFEITERKETEDKLRDTIKEKEVLLKEVHHRVKNNLQVISSILSLQASYVNDVKTLEILKESQDRIKTMSFVHESLYQNSDFSSIKLGDYVSTLAQNLIYSYKSDEFSIKLDTKFDEIFLNLYQAIPCGLIVNELVSNALKHAFKKVKKGKLSIHIHKEANSIYINICDNGVGMPDNISIENIETLGFQLVHALVDQLDGTINVNNKNGTEYLIKFEQVKA